MRVLFDDDEQVSRLRPTRALSAWGHDVPADPDGQAVWEALDRGQILYLISGGIMSGIDGLVQAGHRPPLALQGPLHVLVGCVDEAPRAWNGCAELHDDVSMPAIGRL